MREILFRGKCNKKYNDGDWCYGVPIQCDDGDWQICTNCSKCTVIAKTIGQYTGLTDKNGTKIFEGDIVKTQPFSDKPYSSKAKYKQHIGFVEYRVSHFKNSIYEQDYSAEWRVVIKDYGKFGFCDWNEFFKCEVIGNIHDNPNLCRIEHDSLCEIETYKAGDEE